jgi:citrate lyase beta subunit
MRCPTHVLYGGAQRFNARAIEKLTQLSVASLDSAVQTAALDTERGLTLDVGQALEKLLGFLPHAPEKVLTRTREALREHAIEDFRIDFEDGLGPQAEMDVIVAQVAQSLAELARDSTNAEPSKRRTLLGFRLPMRNDDMVRAWFRKMLAELDRAFATASFVLPDSFALTLPKVQNFADTELLKALATLLQQRPYGPSRPRLEWMIEHPACLYGAEKTTEAGSGGLPLYHWVRAHEVASVHLGAYDYTAELGVSFEHQTLDHVFCNDARIRMQHACFGTPVHVYDGANNHLPLGAAVVSGFRKHSEDVLRALSLGITAGWDLHPAQVAARRLALIAHYMDGAERCAARLRAFAAKNRGATQVNGTFDDEATGRTLLRFLQQARDVGAITSDEYQSYRS